MRPASCQLSIGLHRPHHRQRGQRRERQHSTIGHSPNTRRPVGVEQDRADHDHPRPERQRDLHRRHARQRQPAPGRERDHAQDRRHPAASPRPVSAASRHRHVSDPELRRRPPSSAEPASCSAQPLSRVRTWSRISLPTINAAHASRKHSNTSSGVGSELNADATLACTTPGCTTSPSTCTGVAPPRWA